MRRVGIVGLGLMGGSLARDLLALGWDVRGTDRDAATERAAREAGMGIGIDPDGLDLLVLAVPVRAAPSWLRVLASQLGGQTVVTDVGSTKRSVVAAARDTGLAPRFVGSHPMAGDDRSGWPAAREGLYRGATVWVCPAAGASPEATLAVEELWRAVGARPVGTDPAEHDRRVARSSHLPQAAATALAGVLAEAGLSPAALGPGGRDVTRLAASDPGIWTDILLDNRDEVGPALTDLATGLAGLRRALEAGDEAAVRAALETGRAWRRGGE